MLNLLKRVGKERIRSSAPGPVAAVQSRRTDTVARVEQAVCSRRTKGDRTAVSAPTRTAAWVMMAGMVLLGGCATQGSGSMRDEDQARPEQAGGEPEVAGQLAFLR